VEISTDLNTVGQSGSKTLCMTAVPGSKTLCMTAVRARAGRLIENPAAWGEEEEGVNSKYKAEVEVKNPKCQGGAIVKGRDIGQP